MYLLYNTIQSCPQVFTELSCVSTYVQRLSLCSSLEILHQLKQKCVFTYVCVCVIWACVQCVLSTFWSPSTPAGLYATPTTTTPLNTSICDRFFSSSPVYCPFYGAQELQLAGGPAPSGLQLLRKTPHPTAVQVDQHGGQAQSFRGKVDEGVKGDRLEAGRMQSELDHARMVSTLGAYWGPAVLAVHRAKSGTVSSWFLEDRPEWACNGPMNMQWITTHLFHTSVPI